MPSTSERAARSILALRVQGLPPGAQRLREGQGWADRVGPTLQQGVPRQAPPVRLEGDLPAAEARCREVRAERLRGHHAGPLEPGGLFNGDYLVSSLDNLLIESGPKSTIYRVKEVLRARIKEVADFPATIKTFCVGELAVATLRGSAMNLVLGLDPVGLTNFITSFDEAAKTSATGAAGSGGSCTYVAMPARQT